MVRGVERLCALVLCCTAVGCALDTRTLTETTAGGSTAGSAGTSSTPGGGAALLPGDPPDVDLPTCIYNSAGPVDPGCETLVDNPGFSTTTEGWAAEPLRIEVNWDPLDAMGNQDSGSIAVTNTLFGKSEGIAPGGGFQCLSVTPGGIYDMAADIFIRPGQGAGDGMGAPYVGLAGLSILFWPNATCSESDRSLAPSYRSDLVDATEIWTRVQGDAVAPDNAQSMSVRVRTVKPFSEYSFTALFDNVLVQQRQ